MAKNPLWILERLGPVLQDYAGTIPDSSGRGHGPVLGLSYKIERELRLKFATPNNSVAHWHLVALSELEKSPDFIRYALDTLPRNSVEYHALLMFLRYCG